MQTHAPTVREWQTRHPIVSATDASSLLATVSTSAQALNLPLQRSHVEQNGGVAIGLGEARFEHVVPWLEELTTRYRLRIEWISITRGSAARLVDVQMWVVAGL